jgi:hypothetical protein
MSPIGLEPVDGLGMMGLLDQGGLWGDLDGMYWSPPPHVSLGSPVDESAMAAAAEFAAYHPGAAAATTTAGHHEGMVHAVDYGDLMGHAHHGHHAHHHQQQQAAGMDGFGYVQ